MIGEFHQRTLHLTILVVRIFRNNIFNPFGLCQGDFCFLIVFSLFLSGCAADLKKTTAEEFKKTIHGEAQGTTWTITYYDIQERDFTHQVDSILVRIDSSISTYLPGSLIDIWNKSDEGSKVDALFLEMLVESWRVYHATNGAFDPTVKPLVSYWGFGPEHFEHPETIDLTAIDSLIELIGFDSLRLIHNETELTLEALANRELEVDSMFLSKPNAKMQLDFNAIGQGWSVDKVAQFLKSQGLEIYFVEIGGELYAGHQKPDGSLWRFGVDKPESTLENRSLEAIVNLRNRGLATSGSYRKFYEKDGMRYSHTIDPFNGKPVDHNLLSATVFSSTAAEADGMATAFMVMGKDSIIRFLEEKAYLHNYVFLIYDSAGTNRTYASPQIRKLIEHGD